LALLVGEPFDLLLDDLVPQISELGMEIILSPPVSRIGVGSRRVKTDVSIKTHSFASISAGKLSKNVVLHAEPTVHRHVRAVDIETDLEAAGTR
jgi:hypothetical protein